MTASKAHLPLTLFTVMLRKSFIAAAAAMFSLNIGVTAVAIEQPSEDWRIDDTANRTADGLKATKLNEALHKASPGARQAYTRLQAAYDNPDDAYQIEWGDHGDCGGINCEGSYSCGGVVSWFEGSDVIVDWLNDDAPDLDFDRKYGNGERIICAQSGTERGCATLQNVEKSLTGKLSSAYRNRSAPSHSLRT